MNEEIRLLMSNVNTSIIQIRAAYAMWAKVHGLNYHEVLIFYAMRDNEECTQKKIADRNPAAQTDRKQYHHFTKKGRLSHTHSGAKKREGKDPCPHRKQRSLLPFDHGTHTGI